MKAFHPGPTDRRLVHKHQDENVFVRDLRRAIPSLIDKHVVEHNILPLLDDVEKVRFSNSYYATSDGVEGYALSLAPLSIASRLFVGETSPFSASERKILARYYRPDEAGESHLRSGINEMDDVVLAKTFEGKRLSLATEDLIALANLFENIPGLTLEPVFHAGLNVSASHTFFFEHPNEHVPGMMVVEAARQFAMACWHRFGQVPLQGSQFILNQLNTKFFDYVELNYPATMKAEVKELALRPTGEWETATVIVTVTQGEGVCAEIALPAQVISKRSFQRLRAGRSKTDPQHRFQPNPAIHHRLSLWNTETQKYLDASLVDLSLDGLGAEVPLTHEDQTSPSSWELFLYFEDVGFIRVKAALVWRRPGKEIMNWGFRFAEVSATDKLQLHTVIRQYCQVHRGRQRI